MHVLKFGGSSLANGKKYVHVAAIIKKRDKKERLAVVVSAPKGITNLLYSLVEDLPDEKGIIKGLDNIKSKIHSIIIEIEKATPKLNTQHLLENLEPIFQDTHNLLLGASLLNHCPNQTKAAIVCIGEKISAIILQELLNTTIKNVGYINPMVFIKTSNHFLDAEADIPKSILHFTNDTDLQNKISIMPGFIGSNKAGELTTLGRNGSDYSAAILAVCIKAKRCEIWTDVNGVYSADPTKVKDAHQIKQLSYQEAMELSYFGANILHPKTIKPIAQYQIPTVIKNTFNPEDNGTLISANSSGRGIVKALSVLPNLAMINISGPGMKGLVGMAGRVFSAVSREDVSVVLISQSSSEYCISFCVKESDVEITSNCLQKEFDLELEKGLLEPIQITNELTIISLVGDAMHHQKGVAAKFFTSLAQAKINICAIAQDFSERSISAVIRDQRSEDALNICHQKFFSDQQTIDVFVIGVGVVGSELLEQIKRQKNYLAEQNLILNVYGIANSKHMLLDPDGIELLNWKDDLLAAKEIFDFKNLKSFVEENHLINPVIVDCTSGDQLANKYDEYLTAGFHVVTPNKLANTSNLEYYQKLRKTAQKERRRFLYETNVGAGLPIINTLQELIRAGDQLIHFEGILSGSLSFILGKLDKGFTLSEATKVAMEKGFTEPDPRQDLSGMDVARKVLIIAREYGMPLEIDDIEINSILPKKFDASGSVDSFMKNLSSLDQDMRVRVERASKEGKVLRYVGEIKNNICKVGIKEVSKNHPFRNVIDGENAISIQSTFYQPIPFVVRGYGAGATVTAAGILGDIMKTLAWKRDI